VPATILHHAAYLQRRTLIVSPARVHASARRTRPAPPVPKNWNWDWDCISSCQNFFHFQRCCREQHRSRLRRRRVAWALCAGCLRSRLL